MFEKAIQFTLNGSKSLTKDKNVSIKISVKEITEIIHKIIGNKIKYEFII